MIIYVKWKMKAGQDVWLVGVNVGMYGRGAWSWVQFLCWLKALNYSVLVVTDMVSNPRLGSL